MSPALASALVLALAAGPRDGGADASDDEFSAAFGRSGGANDKDTKRTAYVPPAPGTGAPAPLQKLRPQDVKAVAAAAKDDIARCIDGQPSLKRGKNVLTLKWSVAPDGHVTQVEVVGDALKGSYVAGCVMRLVKRWSFPSHQVKSEPVTMPFRF